MLALCRTAAVLLLTAAGLLLGLAEPELGAQEAELELVNQPSERFAVPGSPYALRGLEDDGWMVLAEPGTRGLLRVVSRLPERGPLPPTAGWKLLLWGEGELPERLARLPVLPEFTLKRMADDYRELRLVHPDSPDDPYLSARDRPGGLQSRREEDDHYLVLTPGAPLDDDPELVRGLPFETERNTVLGSLTGWELSDDSLSFNFSMPEGRRRGGGIEVRVLGIGGTEPSLELNGVSLRLSSQFPLQHSLRELRGETSRFLYSEDNELTVSAQDFWLHRIEIRLEQ